METEKETIEERKEDDKDSEYDDRLEESNKRIRELEEERNRYKEDYDTLAKEHEKVKMEYDAFRSVTKDSFWRSARDETLEQQNDDIEEDNKAPTESFDDLFLERSEY